MIKSDKRRLSGETTMVEPDEQNAADESKFVHGPKTHWEKIVSWRWTVVVIVVAETVFSLIYGLLRDVREMHSGLMFIGLPAVLAILLAIAPKAKSLTGGIMRGITIALLLVAPLLGEGQVCILMAAPLFYGVGLVVALIAHLCRDKTGTKVGCTMLVLLPFCLEGVVPQLTHGRAETVTVSEVVVGTPDEVAAALSLSPRVDGYIAPFWRIGWPRPLAASGEGLDAGATRTIRFSAAEETPAGDLVMRVAESEPGHARFETVSDPTKIAEWMQWRDSDVRWLAVDAAHTRVTWRIDFDRELDPAFYFGPWERVAARTAARYLIAANATPRGAAVR